MAAMCRGYRCRGIAAICRCLSPCQPAASPSRLRASTRFWNTKVVVAGLILLGLGRWLIPLFFGKIFG